MVHSTFQQFIKIALVITACAAPELAYAQFNEDEFRPIEPIRRISGSLILRNCPAQKTDLRVRITPGASVTPTTRTILADGRVKLDYSTIATSEEQDYVVQPILRAGLCAGGTWSPATREVNAPASGVNFQFSANASQTIRLSAIELGNVVHNLVSNMLLKLHNHRIQSSFVQIGGVQFNFNIDAARIDIDCGTFCPDLGDGLFYVNDVNKSAASFRWITNAYMMRVHFEESGREIKGYHSVLGDDGMPDFELGSPQLSLRALPRLNTQGALTFGFYDPHLLGSVQATGACSVGGIEVCNAIFGTDGKVQRAVQSAAVTALNGATVQGALSFALRNYLQQHGVNGRILSLRIEGSDIVLTL